MALVAASSLPLLKSLLLARGSNCASPPLSDLFVGALADFFVSFGLGAQTDVAAALALAIWPNATFPPNVSNCSVEEEANNKTAMVGGCLMQLKERNANRHELDQMH